MYRNLWIGVAAATAVAVLAGCRAPSERREEAIREAAEIHGVITVAGCLQQDAETGQFVVTNTALATEPEGVPAENGTPPPEAMVGAPSTIGTVPAVLEGPRYIVEPPAEVNLQAHSGTQIQVTGTLDPAPEGERPVGTTGTVDIPADVQVRHYGRDVDGRIVADEVRLVADTCL